MLTLLGKRRGVACRDVRTREAGIQDIHKQVRPVEVELIRRDYAANGGWETFLAYEDPQQDILIGLLRLRQLSGAAADRQPGLAGAFVLMCLPAQFSAPLRPLHLYGTAAGRQPVHTGALFCNTYFLHVLVRLSHVPGDLSCVSDRPRFCHAGRVSMVRELHVYGTAVAVHARSADKLQHKGYGTQLMRAAERIARCEHRSRKMAVISGVGTRHYYRKLGYYLEGPYMVKDLGPPPPRRRRGGGVADASTAQ